MEVSKCFAMSFTFIKHYLSLHSIKAVKETTYNHIMNTKNDFVRTFYPYINTAFFISSFMQPNIVVEHKKNQIEETCHIKLQSKTSDISI